MVNNRAPTSLTDTPVTAIVEPSFSVPTNHPPTPNPLVIQLQQPPILTPATTPSSSLQNLPNFASLFGFDYRLKSLEDNFSELRQTNQYAEALSSIPGIVDQYLANKMQEAVDVAVQLKYDRIREESNTENQQFLDSIDEGMKKPNLPPLEGNYANNKFFEATSHQAFENSRIMKVEGCLFLPFMNLSNLAKLRCLDAHGICNKTLERPTFELMKGTCKSLTELEYFCEEVYKATTEKLDWINPEGRQYPHDLRQPLPLVPNAQGRHVIPFHHFINNDLEYLRGGESSRKYSTSVTKTMAADYGISKGKKRRQFYAFATTRESARDVYSKRQIIAVTKVEIVEWQNYKHLDWITVRRDDRLSFTKSVTRPKACGRSSLGVESYQKKLNLTKPDTYRSNLRRRDAYTPYSDPRGFIYENKDKKNRLMRLTNYTSSAMAIDQKLKPREENAELERFIGVRPYREHAEYDESNTYVLERVNTTAGNPVKKILLKLNLSDHSLSHGTEEMVVEQWRITMESGGIMAVSLAIPSLRARRSQVTVDTLFFGPRHRSTDHHFELVGHGYVSFDSPKVLEASSLTKHRFTHMYLFGHTHTYLTVPFHQSHRKLKASHDSRRLSDGDEEDEGNMKDEELEDAMRKRSCVYNM
ncbi:hypothetical protein Tco_1501798 [Tanacetum coccineum]